MLSQRAAALDASDPLAGFRDRFVIGDEFIYLDGNSLGRLPRETASRMADLVEAEWASKLVLGWEDWLDLGNRLGDRLAPLIGAGPGEVAVADQTSVNLYKLASAGLSASGRIDILTDRGNFPSDRYVLGSIAEAAGGRLVMAPEDPTVPDLAEHLGDSIGLVSLSHVSYRSGTLADAEAITELAHDHGALMLWDLAHSAGSVPVDLTGWNADLAVGCTYKYLNAGPGAPGFLFVRSDLHDTLTQPITGWYGHADQFGFAEEWDPATDIRRFLVGTPPIVSMVGVEVGIDITVEATIDALRHKSLQLTSLFIEALEPLIAAGVEIVTPLEPERRASHVTIRHQSGYQIASALRDQGVVPDFRAPDLIRFGFTPLYSTHTEVIRATDVLAEILTTRSFESYGSDRSGVT